jgi:hypothetical protein
MVQYFYNGTIKNITTAVLDIFNDIRVCSYDDNGNPLEYKRVPLTFAPVEKFHQDRIENHYVDSKNEIHGTRYIEQKPRIALTMNGMVYNRSRATGTNQWRYWTKEGNPVDPSLTSVISDYQPTPYDLSFTVYVKSDTYAYTNQILEQILPFFNPNFSLRVKEFDILNIERDLITELDGVAIDNSDDLGEFDSRFCNATMNLTVKAWLYRPYVSSKIITKINSEYFSINPNSISASPMVESFNTSAYEMSAGTIINTSAIPATSAYNLSGVDSNRSTEFTWFTKYEGI